MNDAPIQIMSPLLQYGFAGFSLILLFTLIWLIYQLLKVLKENNKVIAQNTEAIRNVDEHSRSALAVAIECKDKLLARPCMAEFKQG